MKKREKGIIFKNMEQGIAFGLHFKKVRKAQGMTQQELAFEADVERSTIVRIEGAKLNVTIDMVFTLSNALKVHPRELLDF